MADRLRGTEYPVEMALTSLDPTTGHVVAMVGGRDHEASQVNLATGGTTGFQPGSSFKPIVLAAAFEMGLGPETRYPAPGSWHVPGCSGNQCTISNYSHRGYGDITLRSAMHASVNTVFAQLIADVRIDQTIELARKLGLERIDPDRYYGVSLSLGAAESSTLEMASAYGTFANRGVRVAPTGVLRVTDTDGNVLIDNRARPGERVLREVVADNVTDVLTGVISGGTGKRAAIGRPAAGKTGTAQAYRAAWFVGYTPELATAVWMGHADRLASLRGVNGVRNVTGGSHPAVAWADFMIDAHADIEVSDFPEPEEIEPIAETAVEVIAFRVREETVVGEQRTRHELLDDCNGQPCQERAVAPPVLPPPVTPTVTSTTQPPPATDPETGEPVPTTVPPVPPTTAPPATTSAVTPTGGGSTTSAPPAGPTAGPRTGLSDPRPRP